MGVISIRFSPEDDVRIRRLAQKMQVTKTEALRILVLRGLVKEDTTEMTNILWQCLRLCAHVSAESRLARVDYDLTQKPPPDAEEKVQQEANRLFTESVARMNKETTFLETLTAGIPTES